MTPVKYFIEEEEVDYETFAGYVEAATLAYGGCWIYHRRADDGGEDVIALPPRRVLLKDKV